MKSYFRPDTKAGQMWSNMGALISELRFACACARLPKDHTSSCPAQCCETPSGVDVGTLRKAGCLIKTISKIQHKIQNKTQAVIVIFFVSFSLF